MTIIGETPRHLSDVLPVDRVTQTLFVCVRKRAFGFLPRQDGIFTLTLLGMMMLDEARGTRGTTP